MVSCTVEEVVVMWSSSDEDEEEDGEEDDAEDGDGRKIEPGSDSIYTLLGRAVFRSLPSGRSLFLDDAMSFSHSGLSSKP